MDSSVKGVYTEKPPPRRKAPVRKPRAKKEPELSPVITSLISPVERQAIRASQARLMAGGNITRVIKGAIARKEARNMRATKAMDTAGDVLSASKINRALKSKIARNTLAKMKAEDDVITVPVPKPKRAKKEKVVYKMSYSQAVKMWNLSRGDTMWCSPKKGTDEYKAVQALRL